MSAIPIEAPTTPGGPPPLSPVRMILLHLVPTMVATLGYLLLAPLTRQSDLPTVWALAAPSIFLVIPLQLGYLLWLGRREAGRLTLAPIVLNRERIPSAHYFWLVPLLLVWFIAITLGLGLTLSRVVPWLFAGGPPTFLLPTPAQLATQSPAILLGVTVILMLVRLIIGTLVDEYYYRGYLLPRMSNLGGWAPLVSLSLSSLTFVSAPWQTLLPIVGLLPTVYAVSWKRNVGIMIGTRWIYGALTMLLILTNYRNLI